MIRAPAAAMAAIMALGLAVTAADEAPERTRPAALEGSSIAWCGDIEPVRADPAAYRDRPVYVFNEQPREAVAWARQQPAYQDAWIDRGRFGWLTLAFSQDVEARQAELQELYPDGGVVAVEVGHSRRELRRLQGRAFRKLKGSIGAFSIAADMDHDIVWLDVPYVTADVVARLERRFAGEPLCVDGGDPADQPAAGPQRKEGDGWRLVGRREGRGKVYRTGIATDERSYRQVWRQAGMKRTAPAVDFTDKVVLWFAEPHGSSCPQRRFDDIVVDLEAGRVHPLLVDPEANLACTDDIAGSWQFLVELERSRLPAGPFVLQLGPSRLPGRDRTVVDIDLSQPGVVAGERDIHADRAAREPQTRRSGMVVEPFGDWDYAFDVRCGIGYLGEINYIDWVSDVTELPAAWQGGVTPQGELAVSIAIVAGEDAHVEASLNGETVRYDAVREPPPRCEG